MDPTLKFLLNSFLFIVCMFTPRKIGNVIRFLQHQHRDCAPKSNFHKP